MQQRLIPSNGLRHQRSESLLTSIRPNDNHYGNSTLLSPTSDRSLESLEQEIMRLQEVIREREAEIVVLENSIQKNSSEADTAGSLNNRSLQYELSEFRDSLQQDLASDSGNLDLPNKRTSIGRFNELMRFVPSFLLTSSVLIHISRSMAQKESQHQEVVGSLTHQLQLLRRQHDDLNTLSRDQVRRLLNKLSNGG